MIYTFGRFELDPSAMQLRDNGDPVKLEPQVYALIEILVRRAPETVSKQDLLNHVWHGRHVSDAAVNSRIFAARQALGDNGNLQKLIKTIPNVGLRFVGSVQQSETSSDSDFRQYEGNTRFRNWKGVVSIFGLAIVLLIGNQLWHSDTPTNEPPFSVPSEAFKSYQRGEELRAKRIPESLALAEQQFKDALSLSPNFAAAHAGLALTYREMFIANDLQRDVVSEKIQLNLEAAQRLNPDLPEVLVAAAAGAIFERQYEEALIFADQAISKAPSNGQAHNFRAHALQSLGRREDALTAFETAVSHKPLSAAFLDDLAEAQQSLGLYEAAISTAMTNLNWNPEQVSARDMASYLIWNSGDYARSHQVLIDGAKLNPLENFVITDLLFLYNDIDLRSQMDAIVQTPGDRAVMHALRREKEMAKQFIEAAANGYDSEDIFYLLGDFEKAAEILRPQVFSENLLGMKPVAHGVVDWYAEICFTYRQVGEPDADIICRKLSEFMEDKSPDDLPLALDRLGGVAWHILNNDLDTALIWLDNLIEQGHCFVHLTDQPLFAPLRNYPPYSARLEHMKENAAIHRATILPHLGP